jgi:pilus assembly protein CpaC
VRNVGRTGWSAANRKRAAGFERIFLTAGRSTVLTTDFDVQRIAVTNPSVADATVVQPREILIDGKAPGTISLIIWGGTRRAQYDLVVEPGVTTLQQQLQGLFPGENIQVGTSDEAIVLSGSVSNTQVMLRAGEIAKASSSKLKVINLLQLPGGSESQQVMLQVRFAEVNRRAVKELGASWFTGPAGAGNTVGRVTTQQFSAPGFDNLQYTKKSGDFGSDVTSASGQFTFSDFLNVFLFSQKYDLGVVIRALQQKGYLQSLAEPNLIAYNGQDASFLGGRRIPGADRPGRDPTPSPSCSRVRNPAELHADDRGDMIRLKVRPEVSTLDFANGITYAGFRIPSLITRRADTDVELRDGQSFAIAGLLNNLSQDDAANVPFLSAIPIVGALFKSKAERAERTELMVLITPRLVRPLNPDEVPPLPNQLKRFLRRPMPLVRSCWRRRSGGCTAGEGQAILAARRTERHEKASASRGIGARRHPGACRGGAARARRVRDVHLRFRHVLGQQAAGAELCDAAAMAAAIAIAYDNADDSADSFARDAALAVSQTNKVLGRAAGGGSGDRHYLSGLPGWLVTVRARGRLPRQCARKPGPDVLRPDRRHDDARGTRDGDGRGDGGQCDRVPEAWALIDRWAEHKRPVVGPWTVNSTFDKYKNNGDLRSQDHESRCLHRTDGTAPGSGFAPLDAAGKYTADFGMQLTLKTGGANLFNAGSFQALDLKCPGGACYEDAIKHCVGITEIIGNAVTLETGNITGKTKSGTYSDNDSLCKQGPGAYWDSSLNDGHGGRQRQRPRGQPKDGRDSADQPGRSRACQKRQGHRRSHSEHHGHVHRVSARREPRSRHRVIGQTGSRFRQPRWPGGGTVGTQSAFLKVICAR